MSTTSDELIRNSTGRFDFHVELRALAIPEREALLKHQVEEHKLQCSEEVISEIASKCDGYDAYDLVMFLSIMQLLFIDYLVSTRMSK